MKYATPEVELMVAMANDVITTSNDPNQDVDMGFGDDM